MKAYRYMIGGGSISGTPTDLEKLLVLLYSLCLHRGAPGPLAVQGKCSKDTFNEQSQLPFPAQPGGRMRRSLDDGTS